MKRTTVKCTFTEELNKKELTETMTVYVEDPKNIDEVKREINETYKSFNDSRRPYEQKRTLVRFEVVKNETF